MDSLVESQTHCIPNRLLLVNRSLVHELVHGWRPPAHLDGASWLGRGAEGYWLAAVHVIATAVPVVPVV